MYEEVLEKRTKHILDEIAKLDVLKDFYLAGGTALSLQFGHRKSIDLDWFSSKHFSIEKIKNQLEKIGTLKIIEEEDDERATLSCALDGVKLSFFEYKYKNLFPFIKYNKAKLSDPRDIACMKISAISSRGSKKDFIDLYFLLEKFSLKEILKLFDKKYKGIKYNHLHLLKSLSYFETAEKEPMPVMIKGVSWNETKKEINQKVKEYLK